MGKRWGRDEYICKTPGDVGNVCECTSRMYMFGAFWVVHIAVVHIFAAFACTSLLHFSAFQAKWKAKNPKLLHPRCYIWDVTSEM